MSQAIKPLRVYHIDDEPVYLSQFQKLAEEMSELEYCGGSTDPVAGLEKVNELKPDLLILDIEMPERDGFWVAEKLKHSETHIVFVTNHTGYALKAFQCFALHYLEKPLTKSSIKDVLACYRKFKPHFIAHQSEQLGDMIKNMSNSFNYPRRIFVNTTNEILILNLSDIIYVSANGSYTQFYMLGKKVITSGKNLKTYSDVLTKNPDMVKIHRSYIINLSHLSHIDKKRLNITFYFREDHNISVATFRKDDWLEKFNR